MNVKKGDLAVIVSSRVGNRGKIVEVGEFVGDKIVWDGWLFWDDGPMWMVKSLSGPLNVFYPGFNEADMRVKGYNECPWPDKVLRPLKGPENEEERETERELQNVSPL